MSFSVFPVYGYGWSSKSGTIDVPPPFEAEQIGGDDDSIVLKVCAGACELGGEYAVLSIRTRGAPPTYNAYVYSDREAAEALSEDGAVASGFAMLTDEWLGAPNV